MSDIFERAKRKISRIGILKTASLRRMEPTAIFGAGGICPTHIQGYLDTGHCLPLVVTDPNPSAIGSQLSQFPFVRGFLDGDLMLKSIRPKIVSVCTWPQFHLDVVKRAVDAGAKGVLCEKPLTLRLDEAREMVQYCEKNGVLLAGAHQYRFCDPFRIVAKAIASGSLGKIQKIRGAIHGTVANNGPHLIDTLRFLLSDRPLVKLRCSMQRDRKTVSRGYPDEDSAISQLEFDGGVTVDLFFGDAAFDTFRFDIEFEKGKVSVTHKKLESTLTLQKPNPRANHAHARMFQEFVNWVSGRQPEFAASAKQSLLSVEAVLAHYDAAKTDQWLELSSVNQGDVIKQLFSDSDNVLSDRGGAVPTKQGIVESKISGMAIAGQKPTVSEWFSTNPRVGMKEVQRVAKVVLSKKMSATGGTEVKRLESTMSKMYKVPGAVASTSGTSALHVALATWNPDPGSEVITTPVTDMGSIIPILACNCVPVFADIDPMTGNMTAETIAAKITEKTKAVILVHLFGRPADVHGIKKLLEGRSIALIEDCSQAHYADIPGGRVGTVGDFGCFSFQQAKQITCGDGGITLINRPELLKRAQLFIDKGWDRAGGGRAHLFLGMNYRMTEMQAAVANCQLERLPGLIEARRSAAQQMSKELSRVKGVRVPIDSQGVNSSWWIYHMIYDSQRYQLTAAQVCDLLNSEGVKCRNGYLVKPMFQEPVLLNRKTYGNSGYPLNEYGYVDPNYGDYPGTRRFLEDSILMVWSHDIKEKHISSIGRAVEKVVGCLRERDE